jgi:hypothetical protein
VERTTSIVTGRLDQPLEQARTTLRAAAADQGYALLEGASAPTKLVFTKGVSAFSWGSRIAVELALASPTRTELTITTAEKWALIDWGRGRRAARRFLDAVGAEH